MRRARHIALALLAVYLAYLATAWVWFHPSLVNKRVRQQIAIGMPASDIAKIFNINSSFDVPSAAHCGTGGPPNITRIAIYTPGGVLLLPLPMSLPTTTTFCFDRNDKLVAMSTGRWIDGP
jgi:hypothetical protein